MELNHTPAWRLNFAWQIGHLYPPVTFISQKKCLARHLPLFVWMIGFGWVIWASHLHQTLLVSEDFCWNSFVDRETLANGPCTEFALAVLLLEYSFGRCVNISFSPPWKVSSGRRHNLSIVSFNFFCFLNLKELEFESEEKKSLEDRTENLPSAPSHFIPSATSVKHPNCRWKNQSVTEMGPDPGEQDFKVPFRSWRKEEECIWDKNDGKRDIAEETQDKDFCEEEDPSRSDLFAFCPLPKDAAWYKKMFYPQCEASLNPSPEGRLESSDIVRNLLEKHHIPFHSPCFYAARAKCVKSIPGYRELAFPDFWGHQAPPYSKPVLERKHGVQRWLCFNVVTTLRALGIKTDLCRSDLTALVECLRKLLNKFFATQLFVLIDW